MTAPVRDLNDPGQYDDLVAQWWDPAGRFAMLQWIARARAALLPPPPGDRRGVLVDVACGGGLLAPHVDPRWAHIGVDVGAGATRTARAHGVTAVQGDALALPLAAGSADVVVAGEVLEHVSDVDRAVAEVCRVLKPGGTVVIDTIARTRFARFAAVTVAERAPGGPPRRLHDPALFVDRRRLVASFADHGVTLSLHGLVPDPVGYARWLLDRTRSVRLRRIPSTAALFAGVGRKAAA